MKGQDVVVALKLVGMPERPWTYADLASHAGLSASEAHSAVKRLRAAGMLPLSGWSVNRKALLEFLVHGLKYVFPASPGPESVGVPTAGTATAVRAALKLAAGPALVWPSALGSIRGHSVPPLHRSAPSIALRDRDLHELLALVDCLRVGRPRERAAAARVLEERLNRVDA